MLISKKIRLEVSEQDAATLEFMQGKCRGLYNWWIMRLRDGEKWPGWEEAKKTLQQSKQHDNEWGLYTFIQMLIYKCQLYGKDLQILDERDTSKTCCRCGQKQAMPLWKRTYRCPNPECRLVIGRDENSAVNILKRYLARPGPHTGDPVRCADVFTAIEHRCAEVPNATDQCELNTFDYI